MVNMQPETQLQITVNANGQTSEVTHNQVVPDHRPPTPPPAPTFRSRSTRTTISQLTIAMAGQLQRPTIRWTGP